MSLAKRIRSCCELFYPFPRVHTPLYALAVTLNVYSVYPEIMWQITFFVFRKMFNVSRNLFRVLRKMFYVSRNMFNVHTSVNCSTTYSYVVRGRGWGWGACGVYIEHVARKVDYSAQQHYGTVYTYSNVVCRSWPKEGRNMRQRSWRWLCEH